MKRKLLLSILPTLFFANIASAQVNSDDPSFNHQVPNEIPNPSTQVNAKSVTAGPFTIDGEIVPCDSTETTLTVSGGCFYQWYSDSAGANVIESNTDLTVSSITNDTTVYFSGAEVDPATETTFPLPAYSGSFNGNVRGYWFQAPTDLNITKVYVPTDVNAGSQSVAILKFNSGQPPNYSSTTNDFTTLGLWQNGSTDTIHTCISILAGDYVGVLGQRDGANAYAPGTFNTVINGSTVTLERLGMQFPLATNTPQDVWTELGGNISRVELFYGDLVGDTVVTPVNVIAPQPPVMTNETVNFCTGDSVLVDGNYYAADTVVNVVLQNVAGCDSIIVNDIVSLPNFNEANAVDFCVGDSVLVNNVYYSSDGTVVDTLQTVNGCDSIVTTTLTTTALPDNTVSETNNVITSNELGATYQWIDCTTGMPIAGETGVSFTPTANGDYAVEVTTNGCSVQSSCTTISTIGVDELELNFGLSVYPNPTQSELNYAFEGDESLTYSLLDLNGKIVLNGEMTNNTGKIDVSRIASGSYILEVRNVQQNEMIKIVIE